MSAGGVVADGLRAAFGVPGCAVALAALGLAGQARSSRVLGLGQSAFVASGALGLAMTNALVDLPLWMGLVVGVGFASGVGLLLALPMARDVPSDVIAVVALAIAESARRITVATRPDWFGGSDGLTVGTGSRWVPDGSGPFGMTARSWWAAVVGWAIVAGFALVGRLRSRSVAVHARPSIGDDPLLAASMGIDIRALRVEALAGAGALGALGGVLLTLGSETVRASSFSIDLLAVMLAGAVVAGRERPRAAALASALLVGLLASAGSWLDHRLANGGSLTVGSVTVIGDAARIDSLQFLAMGLLILTTLVVRARRAPVVTEAVDGI